MPPETRAESLISDDERTCRIEAIDYSRGTSLLAGVSLSQVIEELNRQYIDGQISNGELSAAIGKIYQLHQFVIWRANARLKPLVQIDSPCCWAWRM